MADSKRIAKNTAFMYVRMGLTMVISLFSVRIVLQTLGAEDYGVYNVTCGVVTMLAFLNNALSSSTQRFLSYEMGKSNTIKVIQIFRNSLFLYIILSILVLTLAETLGLWFVNYKLVIPLERIAAANWIYQFSIISFCLTIMQAPFIASLISHERMGVYAYISIVESVLKLGMIAILCYFPGDKLIIYGLCMLGLTIAISAFYIIYSTLSFEECKIKLSADKDILNEICGFTSWGMLGAISNIFMGQGVNLILNIFFGPLINAARALAFQVDAAINTLIQNFYIAARPQVTKEFAKGDNESTMQLFSLVTRIGFFLMFTMSLVFILEADFILSLWLTTYPKYTTTFTRLTMVSLLIMSLNPPLNMLVNASGNIKYYQIFGSIINTLVLPCSYISLLQFNTPVLPFIIVIIFSVANVVNVCIFANRNAGLNVHHYLNLLNRIFLVCFISSILPLAICFNMEDSVFRLICISGVTFIMMLISAYIISFSKEEKSAIRNYLKKHVI